MGILNTNENNVLNITNDNFEGEVIKCEKTVLIDFYADWCMPCQLISPRVNQIAEDRIDIKVVRINVDDEPEIADRYNIESIPTLVLLKDGREINRLVGLVDMEEILALIGD